MRIFRYWALWAGLGGAGFGALTSEINALSTTSSYFVPLSQVLGVGWSWAAVGLLAGSRVIRRPVVAAILTLLSAVLGYYLIDLWNGVYTRVVPPAPSPADPVHLSFGTAWVDLATDAVFWGASAVVLGSLLGPMGSAVHRGDKWGLFCRPAVPVGAAVEMLVLRLPAELRIQPRPLVVVTMTTIALSGIATAVALSARYLGGRRDGHSGVEHG